MSIEDDKRKAHELLWEHKRKAHELLRERDDYTIFCCADGTLTYMAHGAQASAKIIKAALPVLHVKDKEEAEAVIGLAGAKCYVPNDPYKVKFPAVSGPENRMRYSLPDFIHSDVDTLHNVTLTLAALRDQQRDGKWDRDVHGEAQARVALMRMAAA